jgi:hypothetical protein
MVVVKAGCGLGDACGRGLVGVPWAPAAGPTRPAHPYSAGARHARGDRDADCRCGAQRLQPTKMTYKLYPLNADDGARNTCGASALPICTFFA